MPTTASPTADLGPALQAETASLYALALRLQAVVDRLDSSRPELKLVGGGKSGEAGEQEAAV